VIVRSYGQYCALARALDVVGERWTLLIIRELLLQGACRFTDLKNGLPGIAPNLLSSRLKELEEDGLIAREDAPPPVATTLYALTAEGRSLEPVLDALGEWGRPLMVAEHEGDVFRAHWLAYAAESFTADGDPEAAPAIVQLISGDKSAVIEVGGGEVRSRVGRNPDAELTLDGPPRLILGLITGMIDLGQATDAGLHATGNLEVLTRLRRDSGTEPRVS
jgi:DNA-binding HxlR family transcriptional regulator